MKKILFGCILFLYASFAFAQPSADSVMQATQQWAKAINARDAQQITSLYDPQAYLYATFQNMLDTQQEIYDYFKKLTAHENLQVNFKRENVRVYGDTAINSGRYTFTYTEDGKKVRIPARYTFVYTYTSKGWLIVDHHSSILPREE